MSVSRSKKLSGENILAWILGLRVIYIHCDVLIFLWKSNKFVFAALITAFLSILLCLHQPCTFAPWERVSNTRTNLQTTYLLNYKTSRVGCACVCVIKKILKYLAWHYWLTLYSVLFLQFTTPNLFGMFIANVTNIQLCYQKRSFSLSHQDSTFLK